MAKDGTARGGSRVGSGRKKKNAAESVPTIGGAGVGKNGLGCKCDVGDLTAARDLPVGADLVGVDVPPVKDFMKAEQRCGKSLRAEGIFNEVWAWICSNDCENAVSRGQVEQYAMMCARWIQCEEMISDYGFLARHPTTGGTIASPYVAMSQQYMKQVTAIWFQICQTVKENAPAEVGEAEDAMEKLLRSRRSK